MIKPPKNYKEYERRELEVLRNYGPIIKTCQQCGWPVADGYVCMTCGSDAPFAVAKGQPVKRVPLE